MVSTVASHHEGPGFESLWLRGYAVMHEITLILDVEVMAVCLC